MEAWLNLCIGSIYHYVQGNARSVNFEFATHTGAYAGCPAVLNGALLLFGGYPEQHQVSTIHLALSLVEITLNICFR